MVEKVTASTPGEEILTQGSVYLARLDPSKGSEIGKIRPVILLTSQLILEIKPTTVFVCPLSSQSYPEFSKLHVMLPARDSLEVTSYALPEHCRSISLGRLIYPRLAQITSQELSLILHRLQRLLGL